MAHIFDVLSTINGQLNILAKDYSGRGKAHRLNAAPEFVTMVINRAINIDPSLLKDQEKNVSIEKPTLGSTGDHFNPVYIAVVSNLTMPIVDKVPFMANYKDAHGPGTAYVVVVPKDMFGEETDTTDVGRMLKKIYLGILDMDPEMDYSANTGIIVFHDNDQAKINTYDLTMMLVAVTCININLRDWFAENHRPVGPSYAVGAFPEIESDEIKESLMRVCEKHGKSISEVRDAISNGNLVKVFMYKD